MICSMTLFGVIGKFDEALAAGFEHAHGDAHTSTDSPTGMTRGMSLVMRRCWEVRLWHGQRRCALVNVSGTAAAALGVILAEEDIITSSGWGL